MPSDLRERGSDFGERQRRRAGQGSRSAPEWEPGSTEHGSRDIGDVILGDDGCSAISRRIPG